MFWKFPSKEDISILQEISKLWASIDGLNTYVINEETTTEDKKNQLEKLKDIGFIYIVTAPSYNKIHYKLTKSGENILYAYFKNLMGLLSYLFLRL